MQKFIILFLFLGAFLSSLVFSQQFGFREDKGIIESDAIIEASGIAVSRKNPGVFWTHNDSGDKSRIFAFDSTGGHIATFYLAGVQNRDWEDICIGPGEIEGEQYIYIGNIGDNSVRYFPKYIYRIIEPKITNGETPTDTIIYNVDRLAFGYENGKRNAETLMIDPGTLDFYIVSKEQNSKVYQLAYPYPFTSSPSSSIDTAKVVGELPFKTAVGGDISPDGNEILIKRKDIIYYWKRDENETIIDVLQKLPITVPYLKEPQGEAVCWAPDLSGYYTISEGVHPHLYFYPRVSTSVKQNNNLPTKLKLEQNYPNPFNPTTKIKYSIPFNVKTQNTLPTGRQVASQLVQLKVYDILGKEVATLISKRQKPGNYQVLWDGMNDIGIKVSSGIYFYRLNAELFISTKKMVFLQ